MGDTWTKRKGGSHCDLAREVGTMLLQGNVPSDWEVVSLVSGPSTTIQFLIAYSKHVIENLPVQTSLGNEAKDTCDQKLDKGEDCPLLPP